MSQILSESGFRFDFTAALRAEKLDLPGRIAPEGLCSVDFLIEEHDRLILIEVKNPSRAPEQHRGRAEKRLMTKAAVIEELVPKARDTYTFLHLMKRDTKKIDYFAVVGVETTSGNEEMLLSLGDFLRERLKREGEQPWLRPYVRESAILTPARWNILFPAYPLEPIPGGAQPAGPEFNS